MSLVAMHHAVDPASKLKKELGPLDDIEIFHNQVLAAVYIRPEQTAGGVYLTETTRGEDRFQSKVGLIVKTGANAFVDPDGVWFKDVNLAVGDWVIFRPSDGWSITINGVLCRILDDTVIRGTTKNPDKVW